MLNKLKVYILDDDELVLATLKNAFTLANFEVQTFAIADEFLRHNVQVQNACLILDLSMPGKHGLAIQADLLSKKIFIPIIIYTGYADVSSAVKAMEKGAVTLIQKPAPIDELIHTVEQAISKQKKKLSMLELSKHASEQVKHLSKREQTIAEMVAKGLTANEIAQNLFISQRTVEAHKSKIFNKLDIGSVAELTQVVILASSNFHL